MQVGRGIVQRTMREVVPDLRISGLVDGVCPAVGGRKSGWLRGTACKQLYTNRYS